MKLTTEIERRFYAKFLKALPAGSKAVETETNAKAGTVILQVETELMNFAWETVPGILSIKPVNWVK